MKFFRVGLRPHRYVIITKEQSNTFDALIACHSLVMIRYLLLVYIFADYLAQWGRCSAS